MQDCKIRFCWFCSLPRTLSYHQTACKMVQEGCSCDPRVKQFSVLCIDQRLSSHCYFADWIWRSLSRQPKVTHAHQLTHSGWSHWRRDGTRQREAMAVYNVKLSASISTGWHGRGERRRDVVRKTNRYTWHVVSHNQAALCFVQPSLTGHVSHFVSTHVRSSFTVSLFFLVHWKNVTQLFHFLGQVGWSESRLQC